MPNKLKDCVAIITGAGRGIGRAIAECFATEGCHLCLMARTVSELEQTAAKIRTESGIQVITSVVDVGCEEAFQKGIRTTAEKFGRIDILVNNAGTIGPIGPLAEIDSAEWAKTIQINLSGAFYGIKGVLPIMRRQGSGRIINLSGGGALVPAPYFDSYSVSKAGIVRLTENLALELKGTGIVVSAIAPGGVNTRMFEDMMQGGEEKLGPETWQSFLNRKKAGGDSIDDPVALALYMACEAAPWLNGRVISAKWDPWRSLSEHAGEIEDSDIYTMRRIVPKDRDHAW